MDDFNAELLKAHEGRLCADCGIVWVQGNARYCTPCWIADRVKEITRQHEILRGATVEYHKEKMMKQQMDECPYCCPLGLGDGCVRCHTSDDRYILHGALSRLCSVYTNADEVNRDTACGMYDTVIKELINTLTSYLSQG